LENKFSVLLVDDHPLFLNGLKMIICKASGILNVETALSGIAALEIIRRNSFDLVITDIHMPELSGTELVKIIKRDYPNIKVLVISSYNDPGIIIEIFSYEAEGYILKNADQKELKTAVLKILEGGIYYSQELTPVLLGRIVGRKNSPPHNTNIHLTSREIEILKLISLEYTSTEIADKLFISPLTVETHRKHLIKKTNSRSVVGLVKFAMNNNII